MTPDNIALACQWRRDGRTLEAIGSDLGVTRQRIEQLLRARGVRAPSKPLKAQPQKLPPKASWYRIMYAAGYARCTDCKEWKTFSHKCNRCPECLRAHGRKRYSTPQGKEYMERYRQSERGKQVARDATARWLAKQQRSGLTRHEIAVKGGMARAEKLAAAKLAAMEVTA